ncbi:hypothetical protein KIN20_003537 [Parelaphostrongylus tenuis]|uniref:Uncharacterized protein n=1 Tax=Parelaphostrongylus tenuis TaxID=148309 RepID=A0AAD5MFS0_PARTN|nr:hypothetical protein KIN20_003537 [Parelaphostrongylus tenuis]
MFKMVYDRKVEGSAAKYAKKCKKHTVWIVAMARASGRWSQQRKFDRDFALEKTPDKTYDSDSCGFSLHAHIPSMLPTKIRMLSSVDHRLFHRRPEEGKGSED